MNKADKRQKQSKEFEMRLIMVQNRSTRDG